MLLIIFGGCSEDKPTASKTGILRGKVTLDGIGVSGVEITVSPYSTSGKAGINKSQLLFEATDAGDYSFELYPGNYRADYRYFGDNDEIISTARYPIIIKTDLQTVVDVELKDPVPHSVLALDGDAAVELSWESVYGAVQYLLYRSTSADYNFQIIAEVDVGSGTIYYTDLPQTIRTYYYRVTSVNNEAAESEYEATVQVNFTASIRAPTGLKAFDLAEYVHLSWDNKLRAVYYRLHRSKGNDNIWSVVDSTVMNSYDDAPDDTSIYHYRLTAVSIYGTESVPGNSVSVNFDGKFDPPQGLTIADRGSNLYLNWQDYNNAAYYSIYRSSTPSAGFARIDTVMYSYYSNAPLDTGVYYFYITVTGPNGLESEPSQTVNAHFDRVLDYPSGFSAINKGLYVKLTWSEVLWAGGYRLFRSDDGSTYVQICRTDDTLYNDIPVAAGLYYYCVATETDAGYWGELSPSVTVEFTDNLLAPTGLTVTNNGTSVRLTWDVVEGVEGHEIYRSVSGSDYEFIDSTCEDYFDDIPDGAGAYYYKIRAFDSIGHLSPYSIAAYVHFDGRPLPPDSLVAVDLVYRVYLHWASIDSNGIFMIYRSTTAGGYYSLIDSASEMIYIDYPSRAGYYYYKAQTIAGNDTSDISDYAGVFFSGVLDPPHNISAVDAGTHVQLDWSAPTGADYHKVYRKHLAEPDNAYQLIMTVYEPSAEDAPDSAGTYLYKLKASTRGDLESPYSGPVQVYFEP